MTIANHFNTLSAAGIRDGELTINKAAPVTATPALVGIIAVTVVTSAVGGALGAAAAGR
ncbi:hypothetical protein [Leifsonia virtsii]|uniref:Uncharacterized protein n=1 Tax=Leifsonia virtsii TaxID=3035915 RepID=A0ABT8IYF4_9MICO|nr:hypothetical protein [Leifsonia virtsii]MDN4597851.1 hypothetical protein [Leifsonia virtsii]